MAVNDPERFYLASNFPLDDVVRERALRDKIAAMNGPLASQEKKQ